MASFFPLGRSLVQEDLRGSSVIGNEVPSQLPQVLPNITTRGRDAALAASINLIIIAMAIFGFFCRLVNMRRLVPALLAIFFLVAHNVYADPDQPFFLYACYALAAVQMFEVSRQFAPRLSFDAFIVLTSLWIVSLQLTATIGSYIYAVVSFAFLAGTFAQLCMRGRPNTKGGFSLVALVALVYLWTTTYIHGDQLLFLVPVMILIKQTAYYILRTKMRVISIAILMILIWWSTESFSDHFDRVHWVRSSHAECLANYLDLDTFQADRPLSYFRILLDAHRLEILSKIQLTRSLATLAFGSLWQGVTGVSVVINGCLQSTYRCISEKTTSVFSTCGSTLKMNIHAVNECWKEFCALIASVISCLSNSVSCVVECWAHTCIYVKTVVSRMLVFLSWAFLAFLAFFHFYFTTVKFEYLGLVPDCKLLAVGLDCHRFLLDSIAKVTQGVVIDVEPMLFRLPWLEWDRRRPSAKTHQLGVATIPVLLIFRNMPIFKSVWIIIRMLSLGALVLYTATLVPLDIDAAKLAEIREVEAARLETTFETNYDRRNKRQLEKIGDQEALLRDSNLAADAANREIRRLNERIRLLEASSVRAEGEISSLRSENTVLEDTNGKQKVNINRLEASSKRQSDPSVTSPVAGIPKAENAPEAVVREVEANLTEVNKQLENAAILPAGAVIHDHQQCLSKIHELEHEVAAIHDHQQCFSKIHELEAEVQALNFRSWTADSDVTSSNAEVDRLNRENQNFIEAGQNLESQLRRFQDASQKLALHGEPIDNGEKLAKRIDEIEEHCNNRIAQLSTEKQDDRDLWQAEYHRMQQTNDALVLERTRLLESAAAPPPPVDTAAVTKPLEDELFNRGAQVNQLSSDNNKISNQLAQLQRGLDFFVSTTDVLLQERQGQSERGIIGVMNKSFDAPSAFMGPVCLQMGDEMHNVYFHPMDDNSFWWVTATNADGHVGSVPLWDLDLLGINAANYEAGSNDERSEADANGGSGGHNSSQDTSEMPKEPELFAHERVKKDYPRYLQSMHTALTKFGLEDWHTLLLYCDAAQADAIVAKAEASAFDASKTFEMMVCHLRLKGYPIDDLSEGEDELAFERLEMEKKKIDKYDGFVRRFRFVRNGGTSNEVRNSFFRILSAMPNDVNPFVVKTVTKYKGRLIVEAFPSLIERLDHEYLLKNELYDNKEGFDSGEFFQDVMAIKEAIKANA